MEGQPSGLRGRPDPPPVFMFLHYEVSNKRKSVVPVPSHSRFFLVGSSSVGQVPATSGNKPPSVRDDRLRCAVADPTRDEVQALIDKQEDSLQRIAMWILELPKERRKQAFDVAERTFEQSVGKFGMREEWGRSWIDLSMKRLRSLVIKMGAGGGHGQA